MRAFSSRSSRRGFTLLEVLVALVILSSAFIIIWTTFSTTMRAWTDGSAMLEDFRHGDFVMEQLVSGLRSAAYFEESGKYYGFRMEDKSVSRYPGDWLSWVTASPVFMPPDAPIGRAMHRIELTIEDNPAGDPSIAVRAYPYLADEDEADEAEVYYITSEVQGFNVQFYNAEDEDWEDEWEDTNSVPSLVQVTLFMPQEGYGKPAHELSRVVQIPLGSDGATNAVASSDGTSSTRSRTPSISSAPPQ